MTGLDSRQVRDLVVRPVLERLNLPRPEVAERLLMGTAAQESQFRYLKQLGGGPALGLWQMEPATFADLWGRFGARFDLREWTVPSAPPVDQLVWNLHLACAMARIHYWARPFTMPATWSAAKLGAIWKQHYNTVLGAGKPEEFIRNYRELVAPLYGGEFS